MLTATARRVMEFTERLYLGILTTVYPSGGPQAFPLWYEFDGEHFTLSTPAESAKVRNIYNNPKVALCITDTMHHVKSLTVLGTAKIVMDHQAAQDLHRRLAVRYLGPDEGEDWANSMAEEEMATIRITPDNYLWTG
jgi:PPOX class probable F420-dependent enzyme